MINAVIEVSTYCYVDMHEMLLTQMEVGAEGRLSGKNFLELGYRSRILRDNYTLVS